MSDNRLPALGILTGDRGASQDIQAALPSYPIFELRSWKEVNFFKRGLSLPGHGLLMIDVDTHEEELRRLNESKPHLFLRTPILGLLSENSTSKTDTRAIFSVGVDEWLWKPLNKHEIRPRVERAVKRTLTEFENSLNLIGSFKSELTITELKILYRFFCASNWCIKRDDVMQTVWNEPVHPKTFEVHLFNLRKKLTGSGLKIVSSHESGAWHLIVEDEARTQNEQE